MERFRIQGVSNFTIKRILGRQFLIMFDDQEMMQTMKDLGSSWFLEWFDFIEPWSRNLQMKYRIS
ncbi:hypothetical protein REPUB_Repub15cG0073800 [Reevesia pubescens]